MSSRIIGDRFVPMASGAWFDLAGRWPARLVVHEGVADWTDRAKRLESALMAPRPHAGTLVDFERLGATCWFEATADLPWLEPPDGAAIQALRAALEVIDGVATAWPSVRLQVSSQSERDHLVVGLARALRARGFVAIRTGVPAGADLAGAVRGRHVALLSCNDDSPECGRLWVRRLSGSSRRRHALCLIEVHASVGSSLARERPPPYARGPGEKTFCSIVAARARDFIARADLDAADDVIGAARAEAALEGSAMPAELSALEAQVAFWRGRFEAARTTLEQLPDSVDRTGWLGLLDWASHDVETCQARQEASARAGRRGDRRGLTWAHLLRLLLSGRGARQSASGDSGESVAELGPAPADLQILTDLAAGESAYGRGDMAEVRRICARRARQHGRRSLGTLAARWIHAQAGRPAGVEDIRRDSDRARRAWSHAMGAEEGAHAGPAFRTGSSTGGARGRG